MSSQIITLDAARTVAFQLSEDALVALGLRAGSHLGVSIHGGQIVLQPLLADSLDDLHGIFSSPTDLVEELQRERRKESW